MTARPVPRRHWRSYGDDKLPSGAEALNEPFSAFPSWFLRITCDRCGKLQIVNEAHAARWRDRMLRDILARMRHDGCGGLAGKAELLSGAEGVSSRPVRKISAGEMRHTGHIRFAVQQPCLHLRARLLHPQHDVERLDICGGHKLPSERQCAL
jgi:hypothetical protein